jgi:hypothetical protein
VRASLVGRQQAQVDRRRQRPELEPLDVVRRLERPPRIGEDAEAADLDVTQHDRTGVVAHLLVDVAADLRVVEDPDRAVPRTEDVGKVGPEVGVGHAADVGRRPAAQVDGAEFERTEDLLVAAELSARVDLQAELVAEARVDALGELVPIDVDRLPRVAGVSHPQRLLRPDRRRGARERRQQRGCEHRDVLALFVHGRSSWVVRVSR